MSKKQRLTWVVMLVLGSASAVAQAIPFGTTSTPTRAANLPAPSATEVAAWAATCRIPGEPHPFHVVLDGSSAPEGQRRAVLAKLEQCAQRGNASAQNFIGALYWMGSELRSALVAHDPAKAVMYFSNAAAHGDIADMAKLAEIEIAENRPKAAWICAQLYAHYTSRSPPTNSSQSFDQKYAGDLLTRVNPDISGKQIHDASGDAAAFVAWYGAGISAYHLYLENHRRQRPVQARVLHVGSMHLHIHSQRTVSGLADYLVAIGSDGTVQHVWGIDAYPARDGLRLWRPIALHTRFTPSGQPGLRFQVLHVVSNDNRYTLHGHG